MAERNEYLERTLAMKGVIASDGNILDDMRNTFRAVYDGRLSESTLGIITPPGLSRLGCGTDHIVFGLPQEVRVPGTDRPMRLAIRLGHRALILQYDLGNELGIFNTRANIASFDKAFHDGKNPPYFVGVVTANAKHFGVPKRIAAIVTEDLTFGDKLALRPIADSDRAELTLADGKKEIRFIDPYILYVDEYERKEVLTRSKPYVTPEARIGL